MNMLNKVDLVKVSVWGIVSIAAFAFVTTLWSAIQAPEHVAITGAHIILGTFGWTIHYVVISAVIWVPLFLVVTFIQLKSDS